MHGTNVKKMWQPFPLPRCCGVTDLPSVDTTKSRKWKWLLTNAGAQVCWPQNFLNPYREGIDA